MTSRLRFCSCLHAQRAKVNVLTRSSEEILITQSATKLYIIRLFHSLKCAIFSPLESPGDSKKVVISLEEHEHSLCVCVRCGKIFGEDDALDVDVVIFGVQLNVSSHIDVTIYLSLTVGCIVVLLHGVVSRIVDMIVTIR